ncbi:MAG: hypothetical protein HXX11_01875 [Desulfuromonadales bacterium]|nr:hypothetical protein [Desulfuromonadales bacterium]
MTELQSPQPDFRGCQAAPVDGYVRFQHGDCHVVACEWAAPAIRGALAQGTLHEWAAAQDTCDPMRGRGISYGVMLPAGPALQSQTPVVVRRNRHGGLFRFLTGEYFLMPTRAPLELATALRLAGAGVATPQVIAYAVYPFSRFFARSDVMTRRLPEGADFPDVWRRADASGRDALLRAVARLLCDLSRAGAWHADLNLKNIYIAGRASDVTPYVLDVDRVTFPGGKCASRNFQRLARSVRKWRDKWGLDFTEDALEHLAVLAQEKN